MRGIIRVVRFWRAIAREKEGPGPGNNEKSLIYYAVTEKIDCRNEAIE